MHQDGAGAGGAGRDEFLATTYRGAFGAHLHPIEPGEGKRVGSPRAAIANGSLEGRPSSIRPFHNYFTITFTIRLFRGLQLGLNVVEAREAGTNWPLI